MPKERYSKLPVSVLREMNIQHSKPLSRDPRFEGESNFAAIEKNYSFIHDHQKEQIQNLKRLKKKNKEYAKELIGQEKQILKKFEQK